MGSVGTIFADFDLDYSKFDRNKAKLETSAENIAHAMEANWEKLTESQMADYQRMTAFVKSKHDEILADASKSSIEQARAYTIAADRMKTISADLARTISHNAQVSAEEKKAWADREKEVATSFAKQRQMAADQWNAERKFQQDRQKDAERDHAEYQKRLSSALKEQEEAKQESIKAGEQQWDSLGLKSKAHYDEQKRQATDAYRNLSAQAEKGSQEEYRIRRAYQERLKALDQEYLGQHSVGMEGMINNALRLYAAYFLVSQAVGTIANFFISGLEYSDQMEKSAIAIAGSITSMSGSDDMAGTYRESLKYARNLVVELKEIDKLSFANYEQLLASERTMELQGQRLDMNNQKHRDTFAALTNTIALMAGSNDPMRQMETETRAIFSGTLESGAQVARMIDTMAKKSGEYAGGLKEIVRLGNLHGDTLERLYPFLTGMVQATPDIQNTWEAAVTSLQTSWGSLKAMAAESIFTSAGEDLKAFSALIDSAAPNIAMQLRTMRDAFADFVDIPRMLLAISNHAIYSIMGNSEKAEEYGKKFDAIYAGARAREKDFTDFNMKLKGFEKVDFNPFETMNVDEINRQFSDTRKMINGLGETVYYVKRIMEAPASNTAMKETEQSLREQTRILDSQKVRAKTEYEDEVRRVEMLGKLHHAKGQFQLTTNEQVSEGLANAAEDYATKMKGIYADEVDLNAKKAAKSQTTYVKERELAEKIQTLDADTKRKINAATDDKAVKDETARQRTVAMTSQMYSAISQYSKETLASQLADIDRKYDADKAYVDASTSLAAQAAREADKAKATSKFDEGKSAARSGVLAVIAPDSTEAMEQVKANLTAQMELMDKSITTELERQAWLTQKLKEEDDKRLASKQSFYDGIEGAEAAAYNLGLEQIESVRKADILRYKDIEAANRKANQAIVNLNERRFDAEHKDIIKVSSATGDMFGNAADLMSENSKAYKIFHNAEMAMKAVEIAIEVQKQAMIAFGTTAQVGQLAALAAAQAALAPILGVNAVLNAGMGDPYTAPARMAAMASMVSGILAIAGIGFTAMGGGGGGEAANPNTYASNTGTLLGSSDASESITKVAEALKENHSSEYSRLTDIYLQVTELNANITGLVTGLVKAGGDFSALSSSGASSLLSFTGKTSDIFGQAMDKLLVANPVMAGINKLLGGGVSSAIEGIFGGDTSTSSVASGVKIGGMTIGEILDGVSKPVGQFFIDMKQVTDGGWFHSDKTKFWTELSALDEQNNRLFSQVFDSLGGTMMALATGFGVDIEDKLRAYKVDIGKIDLMGKSGEEISKILTETFSTYGDTLTEYLFGGIVSQYQQINEGMLETASRLLSDLVQVSNILDMTNMTATGTIELSEALIDLAGGLDTLKEAAENYYDSFFTDAEKAADQYKSLSATLGQMGMATPGTREGYRALVESLSGLGDATSQAAYVALLGLSSVADAYYSYTEDAQEAALEDFQEKQDALLSAFESQLDAINKALGTFTKATTDSVIMSLDEILAETMAGAAVDSNTLSAAISSATSMGTEGFTSGMDYAVAQAEIKAALLKLRDATEKWVDPEEIRLELLKEQTEELNELVALTKNATVAPEIFTQLRDYAKEMVKNTESIKEYTQNTSDKLDKFDVVGIKDRV